MWSKEMKSKIKNQFRSLSKLYRYGPIEMPLFYRFENHSKKKKKWNGTNTYLSNLIVVNSWYFFDQPFSLNSNLLHWRYLEYKNQKKSKLKNCHDLSVLCYDSFLIIHLSITDKDSYFFNFSSRFLNPKYLFQFEF